MGHHIVFLGPPGAGKGTHARRLGERFRLPHIATGDLLRSSIRNGTTAGKQARTFVESGKLVPDRLIVQMIKERFEHPDVASGFILDGFPRTVEQAEALDEILARDKKQIDLVIDFRASEETLIERLSGRRTCPRCDANYHVRNIPTRREGICDGCGSDLVERQDDRLETVRARLKVYGVETKPLSEYYERRKLLRTVDGNLGIEELQEKLVEYLERNDLA
ncbi:MAG: adenylate kinase [Omnitrophica bacterium RIFCSPLOWO2_12_FULL_50_11]|nr:MAG: adenylate kinase [Omnitrophica bacterium RIFCSPLOWO2_12_FULL_50_11]